MGTQASQAIPNFLDLAWLACVPINFVPKNKAHFHSLFFGLPKLPYLLILPWCLRCTGHFSIISTRIEVGFIGSNKEDHSFFFWLCTLIDHLVSGYSAVFCSRLRLLSSNIRANKGGKDGLLTLGLAWPGAWWCWLLALYYVLRRQFSADVVFSSI